MANQVGDNTVKGSARERLIELAIVAASIVLSLLFSMTNPGHLLHVKLFDMFMSVKPMPPEWDKITFVDITDESIDLYGRFPWNRQLIGEGIDVMKEFGADKILFDIEFIDPSGIMINANYFSQITNEYMNATLENVWDYLVVEPDKELLRAMVSDGNRNVYMACRGADKSSKTTADMQGDAWQMISSFASQFFITNLHPELSNSLPVDKFLEFPTWPLYMGAAGMGTTRVDSDPWDGVIRRIHLFHLYEGYLIPQLTLPVLFDELGVDRQHIEIRPGTWLRPLGSVRLPLTNGDVIDIPIDREGQMVINWTKPWHENPFGAHVPFHVLLQYSAMKNYVAQLSEYAATHELTPDQQEILDYNKQQLAELMQKLSIMAGKILIVGVSAESATDIGPVAIDTRTPKVITHANVLNTIYQRAFLYDAPITLNWLVILILTGVLVIIGRRIQSAAKETLFSGVLIIGLFIFDYLFIVLFGIILNYSLTLFALLLSFVAMIVFKFILYDKQKNYIKSAFMSYLSPEVVQQVIQDPDLLKLGGKRMEITAYFSDVQGFTSISEQLSPEQIVSLLNEYLTAMSDIILKYGGTVDKYEGDAIVAFFGAPIPHSDHALRCCKAAVEMQKTLSKLRQKWVAEGLPNIFSRIGMNTGFAIIGNMGSQQRMNYTMMGDSVNLAARLEGANKAYGTYTMISEYTYQRVQSTLLCRKLDKLQVVGKKEPITVYELIDTIADADPKVKELVAAYNAAYGLYERREWSKAKAEFERIAGEYKDPPSVTYAGRCAEFIKKPPSKDWDGVFILKSK